MLGVGGISARVCDGCMVRPVQVQCIWVWVSGDGANDSGALKAADVGISIASAPALGGRGEESSTAPRIAAPFYTPLHHIGAVGEVGRMGGWVKHIVPGYLFLFQTSIASHTNALRKKLVEGNWGNNGNQKCFGDKKDA